jgi:hypothetical protein
MYFINFAWRVVHMVSMALLLLSCNSRAAFDSDLLAGLSARPLAAPSAAVISAIDALQSNPNFIIIGVSTGGVWISENGGLTWTPAFDDQPVASIGAVAINQDNPDIIWVGRAGDSEFFLHRRRRQIRGRRPYMESGGLELGASTALPLHPDNHIVGGPRHPRGKTRNLRA